MQRTRQIPKLKLIEPQIRGGISWWIPLKVEITYPTSGGGKAISVKPLDETQKKALPSKGVYMYILKQKHTYSISYLYLYRLGSLLYYYSTYTTFPMSRTMIIYTPCTGNGSSSHGGGFHET